MAVMKSAVLVALVLPLMTGCATTQSKSRSVRSTTVCGLLANPRQFDRSTVKLPADVLSDGRHLTLLVDNMCQPGGISIGFGSEKDPEDVAGLFRALFTGIPGTEIDKHIRAGKGDVRQARRADGGRTPGRLYAADQSEEVGRLRRFELTIRLTKKSPRLAQGALVLLANKVLIALP